MGRWFYSMTIIAVAFVLLVVSSAQATRPRKVRLTDINDRQFAVVWITPQQEIGSLVYGTSPDNLNQSAPDVRSEPNGFAHLVRVGKLAPNKIYYFEIISGGIRYDNDGVPWEVETGLPTGYPNPPDPHIGLTRNCAGIEPKLDIVVMMTVLAQGKESVPRAYIVHLIHPNQSGGMFSVNTANSRDSEDIDQILEYTAVDQLRVEVMGEGGSIETFQVSAGTFNLGFVDFCPLEECQDEDNDGYGDPGSDLCPNGTEADCNDNNETVYPGADEICDNRDNDCNDVVDDEPYAMLFCQDGLYCNGQEYCGNHGICKAGQPIDCADGVFCNGAELCNEDTDRCVENPAERCPDDDIFCNGVEGCNEDGDNCYHTGDPCEPGDACNESTDACDSTDDDDDDDNDSGIDDDDDSGDTDDAADDGDEDTDNCGYSGCSLV